MIPPAAILVKQENGLAVWADASARTGCLDLHQCYQSMHFRFLGHHLRQDAPQAQGVLAQRRAQPIVAGGRRVALVEDQVDDRQHR